MSESKKYRLVTRSDFDGLVCAVLFKELDMIDDILFVHPKDMQDGKIEITQRDITTNLPYVDGCHMAFDHHLSETVRCAFDGQQNHIIDADAPSAARVVYEYFGATERFTNVCANMMVAVDKGDSADFTREEILNPDGWVLLNFLMDARTGLGRFREFRVSNYQLMMQLIDCCRNHPVDQILELPDVAERVELYRDHSDKAVEQLKRCSTGQGNAVVLDLRDEEVIYATNRFTIYALFPEANVSIHAMWGLKKQNTVFAVGNSILNRTSRTNIGMLCLKYGGGGHHNAGTCQVENETAAAVLEELVTQINEHELAAVTGGESG